MTTRLVSGGLAALALWSATAALAAPVADAAGDFTATYAGPRGGDLDVLATDVVRAGDRWRLTATLAAPVGSTPGAFYVWGFDRGEGTARFGTIMGAGGTTYDATGVLFDAVAAIRPGGASTVVDLAAGSAPVALAAGDVQVTGSELTVLVPVALLPSRGRSLEDYTFNLWPRFASAEIVGNVQISDFAPDNATARVSAAAASVPLPATALLLAAGALAAVGVGRRAPQPVRHAL